MTSLTMRAKPRQINLIPQAHPDSNHPGNLQLNNRFPAADRSFESIKGICTPRNVAREHGHYSNHGELHGAVYHKLQHGAHAKLLWRIDTIRGA